MDRLNQWLGLVGNFGVIAGLLLLAFELHQNSNLMRAQTRHELAVSQMDLIGLIAESPDLATAMTKLREDQTQTERVMLRSQNFRAFYLWADAFYQYRMGLFDETEFQAHTKIWERVLETQAGFASFCVFRSLGEPEFVSVVDGILERMGSPCPTENIQQELLIPIPRRP